MPRYTTLRPLSTQIIFLCAFLLLSACGGGSSGNSDQKQAEQTHGNAVKGVISNGIVKAFDLSVEPRVLLSETRTDDQGDFSLPFYPQESLSQPLTSQDNHAIILLELSTDSETLMRCDLTSGCIENSTGQLIEFGQTLQLPSHFKMLGVVTQNQITRKSQAFLSPLSHIIISTAQKLPNGLSSQNIKTASEWLASTFELDAPPLDIETPDLTALLNLDSLSDQQLKQGILSAVFYDDTLSETWSQGAADLDSISLENIFNKAAGLASQLASRLTKFDNAYASSLATISSQAQQQYEAIAASSLAILTQPSSITLNEGGTILLRVQASGDGPISYQWQKDDIDIPDANSANYAISSSLLSDTGTYSVVVRNATSSLISLHALVIVNKELLPVSITKQPVTTNVAEGETISLSVNTLGDGPISYQWQKNGSLIPGASLNTLTFIDSSKSDEGVYRVIVSNKVNQLSSDFVNVWVSSPISPIEIINQPQSQMINEGVSVSFSVSAIGGGFISYQWQKDEISISNAFDSLYRITASTASDAGSYSVVISNSQGSISSNLASLTVISNSIPVSITLQPQSQSINIGGQATLSTQALGDGPLQYQWFLNDALISGATQSDYVISNAALTNEGIYTVKVQNGISSELSLAALLTVNSLPSVQLNWTPPTQREDASPLALNEISGYLIQYGSAISMLNNNVRINDGLTSSYTLSNLASGLLYMKIATIDSDGQQGQFSNVLSVNIK